MKKALSIALAAALALSVAACGSSDPVPTPETKPETTQTETESAVPESEPIEEPEPEPEEVIIPEPIVYTGTGDNVIELSPFDGAWVFEISGNSDAQHFAVKGYDDSGKSTDLFVNTTDPYSGYTIDPSQTTSMLEVSATGDWSVTVRSILDMPLVNSGDTFNGTGDAILRVGTYGKTASISGNAEERHFSVKSYGETGNDLMVNTTDKYEGTVMLKDAPLLFVISAEGEWQIIMS